MKSREAVALASFWLGEAIAIVTLGVFDTEWDRLLTGRDVAPAVDDPAVLARGLLLGAVIYTLARGVMWLRGPHRVRPTR